MHNGGFEEKHRLPGQGEAERRSQTEHGSAGEGKGQHGSAGQGQEERGPPREAPGQCRPA